VHQPGCHRPREAAGSSSCHRPKRAGVESLRSYVQSSSFGSQLGPLLGGPDKQAQVPKLATLDAQPASQQRTNECDQLQRADDYLTRSTKLHTHTHGNMRPSASRSWSNYGTSKPSLGLERPREASRLFLGQFICFMLMSSRPAATATPSRLFMRCGARRQQVGLGRDSKSPSTRTLGDIGQ
jgi:hypothetical protein